MSETDVLILCGGKGTRSYPFTEYFPKVMMPVGGSPILVHLMRIYAKQGFSRFVLAAGHRKEILLDYFDGRYTEWDVRIVDTGEASDTAERIRRCIPVLSPRFFATYGDGLGNVDLGGLMACHEEHSGIATVTAVPLRSQYGTMIFDSAGRVERFEEKPIIRQCWINAGFFVFEKQVFDRPGENLEQDILPALAREGSLYTHMHNGYWRSMDTSKDQQELDQAHGVGVPPWMEPPPQALASTSEMAAAAGSSGD